ncbi:hypothetical protein [Sphingomonas sp. T9W2]|uniref:hypothetical protein n=1 Tax=Sphingomonas sp. T9W2 TaxID=3143183 RepID=UPI0031F48BD9
MKHYRYERDLEGSPIGTVRKMTAAEAEPLLKSGAVEETDEDVTEDATPDEASKPSVTTEQKPARQSRQQRAN